MVFLFSLEREKNAMSFNKKIRNAALFLVAMAGYAVQAQNIDYKLLDTAKEEQREQYLKSIKKKFDSKKTASQYYNKADVTLRKELSAPMKTTELQYLESDSCVRLVQTERYAMGEADYLNIDETLTQSDYNKNGFLGDSLESQYKVIFRIFNFEPKLNEFNPAQRKGLRHITTITYTEYKSGRVETKINCEDKRTLSSDGKANTPSKEDVKFSNNDTLGVDPKKLYQLLLSNMAKGFKSSPDEEAVKNLPELITPAILQAARKQEIMQP